MKIKKIRNVKTPSRGTVASAGFDFYIPEDMEWENKTLRPGEDVNVPSGIKADVPDGFALVAFNKSGRSIQGLQVGACVVDSDYQGEIHLHVFNRSNKEITLKSGEKLVQFILIPVSLQEIEVVEAQYELFSSSSNRGEGGFGSTGLK